MTAMSHSRPSIVMFVQKLDDRAVARVVLAVAGQLRTMDVPVTIMGVSRDPDARVIVPPRVQALDLGLPGLPAAMAIPRLARYLRRQRPDVVFAHLNGPARAALLARGLARVNASIVVVEHTHHGTFYTRRKWLRDLLTTWLFRHAERVAGTSAGVVDDLEARFPGIGGRTLVLPSVGPSSEAVALARSTLPDHPWYRNRRDIRLICCVANLVPRKGQDALVDALPLLRSRCGDVRLVLVGRPDDHAFVASLRRRAAALGLSEEVSIVGYQPDALRFIANADVLALTSHTEGFGMVLVEALACGLPVVATDCPVGPRAVLQAGRCGWLVPPGNIPALVDALAEALSDDERRTEMAATGRARAGDFAPATVARAYLAAAVAVREEARGRLPPR